MMWLQLTSEKSHDIKTGSRDCKCDICTKSRDCTCDICTISHDCTCDICTNSRDCTYDICTKSCDCAMLVQIYIPLITIPQEIILAQNSFERGYVGLIPDICHL